MPWRTYYQLSYSGGECARAAVEILNILCTDAEVPSELRKEVFNRVLFACEKELYQFYHKELRAILTNPALGPELNEFAPD
jgi:primosomal protein N''